MPISESEIIGKGIYSIPEAARFAGLSADTVRRWAFGYRDHTGIIDSDLPRLSHDRALSFLALIELCLMSRFKKTGLPARKLREGAEQMLREDGIRHPFAFEHLLHTDGVDLFLISGDSTRQITGRHRGHLVFKRIVENFFKEIEFQTSYASKWRPAKFIVLDPTVRFGEPIIEGTRIPTSGIHDQLEAGDSASLVARCYHISIEQVHAAKGFEKRLLRVA